jgi:lipoate-protein ligase A
MAIDEAILNSVCAGHAQPTIRFYDWNPPTISCGYNQSIEKEIDLDLVKSKGYGVVRRPTGGRVVLHEAEVTYSIVTPCEGRFAGTITESYFEISQALAAGFQLMGIKVDLEREHLSSNHQRMDSNPCFASSSKYELNYQNRKIVGSAQVRKNGCLLQHGSILLNKDQSSLADVIPKLDKEKRIRLAKYLTKKTVAINQILNKPITYTTAVDFILKGFMIFWREDGFEIAESLKTKEESEVYGLLTSKYLTDEWNKRK